MDNNTNDHDLLLTLKAELTTKLDRVINDVRELKDNVAQRVSNLEEEKADKTESADHEERLRFLEKWVWTAIGALIIIQFIIGYYLISKFGNTPL